MEYEDIVRNNLCIEAERFNKHVLIVAFLTKFANHSPSLSGGISGIKNLYKICIKTVLNTV